MLDSQLVKLVANLKGDLVANTSQFRANLKTKPPPERPGGGVWMLDVIPLGFEPKTHSLEGCCSIQLSYGTRTPALKADCKYRHFPDNSSNRDLLEILFIIWFKKAPFLSRFTFQPGSSIIKACESTRYYTKLTGCLQV